MEGRAVRILAATLGSSGDVDPIVGLGRVLARRGHEVIVLTHAPFEAMVRRAGLEFVPVDTREEYEAHLQTLAMDPGELLVRNLVRSLEPVYARIAELHVPGETAVVAQTAAMGARLAHDRFGMPMATVHLQPFSFPPPEGDFDLPPFHGLRERLGLPPVGSLFSSWNHSPQLVLALFPRWFAPALPVPEQTRFPGFPLFDEAPGAALPAGLEEFLNAGQPPVVFTFGTAMSDCGPLLQASAQACAALGQRGLLLTRYRDQVPSDLPEGVAHFDFIPFSAVLPRAAAIVHHGGIGTTAQALAAGLPQVITPFAFDQPQNAKALEALGVGLRLRPRDYDAASATAALRELPRLRGRAQELRRQVAGQAGLETAADLVEAMIAASPPRTAAPRP